MKNILYFIVTLLSVSCIKPKEQTKANRNRKINEIHLSNTIWIFTVSKECIDSLKLNSNKEVITYDCEMNYTFHGVYEIIKDTLIVSAKDDSHSENGNRAVYFKDKYLIKNNSLHFIRTSKMINGKWEQEKMMENTGVIYEKAK